MIFYNYPGNPSGIFMTTEEVNNNFIPFRIAQNSLVAKDIYVFTPKGDTIQLLAGSTPIDFAYRIHSGIGDKCYGAKINNKMAKISDELKTGDLVEILTTKKNNVNKDWLTIAKASATKEMIRKAIGQSE